MWYNVQNLNEPFILQKKFVDIIHINMPEYIACMEHFPNMSVFISTCCLLISTFVLLNIFMGKNLSCYKFQRGIVKDFKVFYFHKTCKNVTLITHMKCIYRRNACTYTRAYICLLGGKCRMADHDI